MWLAANSGYRDIPPPKQALLVPASELSVDIHGYPGAVADGRYRCSTQTLYMKEGTDFGHTTGLSALVHELTHHAQCVTGWNRQTTCEKEREAYAMSAKFLQQFVTDPEVRRRDVAIIMKAADVACENLNRR